MARTTDRGAIEGEYIDPAPVLAKLTVPVVALYGQYDARVNAEENAAIMRAALDGAGNRDVTIRIIPNADHDLWFATRPTFRDAEETTVYAPGNRNMLVEWIVSRSSRR